MTPSKINQKIKLKGEKQHESNYWYKSDRNEQD